MSPSPLRLVVYDTTDRGVGRRSASDGTDGRSGERLGLAPVWWLGASLHRGLARVDGAFGARSWDEALRWAVATADRKGRPIGELQAWGHGGWGGMRMGATHLEEHALGRDAPLAGAIDALIARLAGREALVWLRCCSAFGRDGRAFAATLADRLGCRVAGHTFVIGFFQSGLHTLAPGSVADWDEDEGVVRRGKRRAAAVSSPFAPRTITALRLGVPAGY